MKDASRDEITIRLPGKPYALLESFIKEPMQSIALMSYQETITRAVKASFANTDYLPLTGQVSIEVTFYTRTELNLASAVKPILDALKNEVYTDDACVRSLTIQVCTEVLKRKDKGPDDIIAISLSEEKSVPGVQPYKTLSFLPITVKVRAVPRMDEPPHSKKGKIIEARSDETMRAIEILRESIKNQVGEPFKGNLMLSAKIRASDRKLDLDNILGLYIRAMEGTAFESITQVQFVYISFMDLKVFTGNEEVYLTISSYDPNDW